MDKLKLEEQSKKLLEIHRGISGFYNEFAKFAGLTLAGLEVLHIIWDEEECTQKTIVQKAFLPKQTVNAIIQKFLKLEIIELSAKQNLDKRNKIIKFTEKGKTFANKIILKIKDIEYTALDALGEKKREELINIMTLYKDNLKDN